MFTGIIEEVGHIQRIESYKSGLKITVSCGFTDELKIDESISVNGACQTVVALQDNAFSVVAVEETLRKTTLGKLKAGDKVNLERAMRMDRRLDGHIVQGHVDGVGRIRAFSLEGANWLLEIEYPDEFRDLIVGRGSIAVDGISLTVARESGNSFLLAIIPYTYENTHLHTKKVGDAVNLEFDILGKYVLRYMENRSGKATDGLTLEQLSKL